MVKTKLLKLNYVDKNQDSQEIYMLSNEFQNFTFEIGGLTKCYIVSVNMRNIYIALMYWHRSIFTKNSFSRGFFGFFFF